jgi:hypothetical protein
LASHAKGSGPSAPKLEERRRAGRASRAGIRREWRESAVGAPNFFKPFGRLHPTAGFPHVSLFVLGVVSILSSLPRWA